MAINKKVPPWYAVLTGSVVDSDVAKIDIFLLTSMFFETFLPFLAPKVVSQALWKVIFSFFGGARMFGEKSFYATAPRVKDWEEFKRTIN